MSLPPDDQRSYRCHLCGGIGHNRTTCPDRHGDERDYTEYRDEKKTISAAERVMEILEQKMLSGWGESRCRTFITSLGITIDQFSHMYTSIKDAWQTPDITYERFMQQRDLARARYLNIYEKCMERGEHKTALGAVNSVVKLDGLEQPEKIQVLAGAAMSRPGITNSVRDTVSQLVEKMRELAAARQATDAMMSGALVKATNGHGTNGHAVIDVPNEDGEIEGKPYGSS